MGLLSLDLYSTILPLYLLSLQLCDLVTPRVQQGQRRWGGRLNGQLTSQLVGLHFSHLMDGVEAGPVFGD